MIPIDITDLTITGIILYAQQHADDLEAIRAMVSVLLAALNTVTGEGPICDLLERIAYYYGVELGTILNIELN